MPYFQTALQPQAPGLYMQAKKEVQEVRIFVDSPFLQYFI
jgi:hypothetical protein